MMSISLCMRYLLLTLALLLTACTALPSRPSPPASMPVPVSTPAPNPSTGSGDVLSLSKGHRFDDPIAGGLRFLRGQYNAEYGLLQESPNIGQHRYYLTNDNALAAYVFAQAGDTQMAERLRASLARYGYDSNGFIEVVWGEEIAWPPRHHKDIVVEQKTNGECDFLDTQETGPLADCVLQETHTDDLGFFYDWSSFSNLHCMGAVNEYNKGNLAVAQWLYATETSTFDGHGWADEAWRRRDGTYETIGPAWCLYAGALLQAPIVHGVLSALLNQQDPISGGFHTHYQANTPRLTDANVETTALALLALLTLQNGPPPKKSGLGFPGGSPPNP